MSAFPVSPLLCSSLPLVALNVPRICKVPHSPSVRCYRPLGFVGTGGQRVHTRDVYTRCQPAYIGEQAIVKC
jgi:hypothetical protein